MRLFPRSLKGQEMEWFTNITPLIKTFKELAQTFFQHFAYNLSRSVTLLDLCNTNQNQGKLFVTFFQRWTQKCSLYSRTIHENEKIEILISNMIPKMQYKVKKMVFQSFDSMVEITYRIEDVLKEQGILAKQGNNNNNGHNKNNKDKGKKSYWNRKKQVVNDGFVDSSKPIDQVVLLLISANQKGNKPRYQDRPKGGK